MLGMYKQHLMGSIRYNNTLGKFAINLNLFHSRLLQAATLALAILTVTYHTMFAVIFFFIQCSLGRIIIFINKERQKGGFLIAMHSNSFSQAKSIRYQLILKALISVLYSLCIACYIFLYFVYLFFFVQPIPFYLIFFF